MKRISRVAVSWITTNLAAACVLVLPTVAPAQAASSATCLLVTGEPAPGGSAVSTTYRLTATFGAGVPAARAASTNFRLLGGFNAALDVTVTGRPWLTGLRPLHGPLLGGTAHTVHGTELHLGAATNVTVGGAAAIVSARARDHVKITLPAQTAPGWKTVTATNSGGTAFLARGIGVLPLLDRPRAIEIGRPFRLTYRGTKGDMLYLAAAGARLPAPVTIPPYHHGLELNPGVLLALLGPLVVTDAAGVLHLDFPGIPFARPLFVQVLAFPSGNPGYAPGSFTNVLAL